MQNTGVLRQLPTACFPGIFHYQQNPWFDSLPVVGFSQIILFFATYFNEAETRILGFSWFCPELFDILQIFKFILNGNVKGFQKMYNMS